MAVCPECGTGMVLKGEGPGPGPGFHVLLNEEGKKWYRFFE